MDKYLSLTKRHAAISLNPSVAIFHPTERNKIQKQPKHSGESTDFSFLTRGEGNGRLVNYKNWVKIWVDVCSLSSVICENKPSNCFVWGRILVITLDLESF